jgi:hypothetical protein
MPQPQCVSRLRPRDLRVFKPIRAKRRSWFARSLPIEVILVEGLAIAVYGDDRSVQYGSLEDLLHDHGLTTRDLALA